MFKMESHSSGFAPRNLEVGGYSDEQVSYHIWLLGQAGLMRVVEVTTLDSGAPQALPINLTWEGHDFVHVARNDTTWSRAMEKVKTVGGSLSFRF